MTLRYPPCPCGGLCNLCCHYSECMLDNNLVATFIWLDCMEVMQHWESQVQGLTLPGWRGSHLQTTNPQWKAKQLLSIQSAVNWELRLPLHTEVDSPRQENLAGRSHDGLLGQNKFMNYHITRPCFYKLIISQNSRGKEVVSRINLIGAGLFMGVRRDWIISDFKF